MIRRLREIGVLGINRRNARYTLAENPRRLYPLVDDKLATKALCIEAGIPTAGILGKAAMHSEIASLLEPLRGRDDFVLKPARGAMGNGIIVITESDEAGWTTASGRLLVWEDLHYHAAGIVSGLYALGGQPDVAFAEERLRIHPSLSEVSHRGVPDIRVVVHRGVPVMAMTRLPTRGSSGKANLHQGAVGAGIALDSGRTTHAVIRDELIERHPDTGVPVVGLEIPLFAEALDVAVAASDLTGLGYTGADIVIDATRGPLVLELNARPGLSIQIANQAGLIPRLEAVQRVATRGMEREERIELGRSIARGCA